VHFGEVAQIDQKDIQLHHVLEGTTGGFCHRFEILEHAHDVGFDIAFHHVHGGGVQRNLAGQINRVAHFDGLGVGADGGGGFVGGDDFALAHGGSFRTDQWNECVAE